MPTTIYTGPSLASSSSFAGITFRNFCQAIAVGQGQVRVTFQAGTSGLQADHCSIGVGNGTNADTAATPSELLFSGASGFSIGANALIASDWLTFVFAGMPILIPVIDVHSSGNTSIANANTGSNVTGSMFLLPGASYNVATPTSSYTLGPSTWGVTLIETQAASGATAVYGNMTMMGVGHHQVGWTPSLGPRSRVFRRRNRLWLPW